MSRLVGVREGDEGRVCKRGKQGQHLDKFGQGQKIRKGGEEDVKENRRMR